MGRKPPPWPLAPVWADLDRAARLRLTLAHVLEEHAETSDARRRWRLARRIDTLRRDLSVLERATAAYAAAELALWADVWRRPQAALWHRASAAPDVALYVRHTIRAEHGDYRAARESRQWSDRLGLNPLGLQRLRWWDAIAARIPTRRRPPTRPAATMTTAVLTQARNRVRRPSEGTQP